jgi:predicted nucleic acid-binding protein
MLYLDTSALLPYYREESASERVEAMLMAQFEPVLISHVTEVEAASALSRWVRTGELSEVAANRIESAFLDDATQGRFRRCPVDITVCQRAFQWVSARKTPLRTLDALHLACAESHQAQLVTKDQALLEAAAFFGLDARRAGP